MNFGGSWSTSKRDRVLSRWRAEGTPILPWKNPEAAAAGITDSGEMVVLGVWAQETGEHSDVRSLFIFAAKFSCGSGFRGQSPEDEVRRCVRCEGILCDRAMVEMFLNYRAEPATVRTDWRRARTLHQRTAGPQSCLAKTVRLSISPILKRGRSARFEADSAGFGNHRD